MLDTQTDTAGSIQAWAANLASITGQLQSQDAAVAGILNKGPGAADEVRALFDRLQPTLPIVLANLVSIGEVAVTYQPSLEQLLVLLPQGTAVTQAVGVHKRNTKQDYKGDALVFNLNLLMPLLPAPLPLPPQQIPPPCTTGFLPAQQQRVPTFEDYPDRPPGDVYCRVPQDAPFNVRGARNLPCETVPGKRAPTVKMCESNENYVPLNDGYNWKGDPNATLSGQPVPQLPPGGVTCRTGSCARAGAAADSGRRIRPRHWHVRWTGRARVHTSRPGPWRQQRSKHGRRCCCPRRGTERGHPGGRSRSRRIDRNRRRRRIGSRQRRGRLRTAQATKQPSAKPRMSHVRLATILGLVAVVALAGLCGWLGFRAYESRKAADQRNLFLQVGRQGALNLTTIDFEHVDDDVKRILDSSTGTFYDDFQARAQPFTEVVKQAKSKSVGSIAEAGVESETGDGAEVLVAVTVKTSNAGAAEQEPRAWRMRITVQKVGDEAKVANVRFVS